MLVEKYKPRYLREVVGQNEAVNKIIIWLRNWTPEKALLLHGPPGSGKSSIVRLIAEENNLDFIELNASDDRTAEKIEGKLSSAVKQKSLFKKGKIIVFDEIDGLSSGDRGGASAVLKIIKDSAFPVMLIANDAYSPKLRSIRQSCDLIQLKKVHSSSVEKFLREICLKEGIKIDAPSLKMLAKMSEGDIRSALNDLESLAAKSIEKEDIEILGKREREKNIFEVLRAVFKAQSVKEVNEILRKSDKGPEEILWWVEQNITNEYKTPEEIAKALDILSKIDLFRSRIFKNQNYRFLAYMQSMFGGIGLAKEKPNNRFTAYRPPEMLMMMGRSKSMRQKTDLISKKLGSELHCSKKIIKANLQYLKMILKNKECLESVEKVCPEISEIL